MPTSSSLSTSTGRWVWCWIMMTTKYFIIFNLHLDKSHSHSTQQMWHRSSFGTRGRACYWFPCPVPALKLWHSHTFHRTLLLLTIFHFIFGLIFAWFVVVNAENGIRESIGIGAHISCYILRKVFDYVNCVWSILLLLLKLNNSICQYIRVQVHMCSDFTCRKG